MSLAAANHQVKELWPTIAGGLPLLALSLQGGKKEQRAPYKML